MIFTLKEIPDLLCDCCIKSPQNDFIFASIWGRDTAMQELLAKLTIGRNQANSKMGLNSIELLNSMDVTIHTYLRHDYEYDKKITKVVHPQFGLINHLWLYDKRVKEPCRQSQSAILLFDDSNTELENETLLYQTIKYLTSIPFLEHWDQKIIDIVKENGMLTKNESLLRNINSYTLTLQDQCLASHISEQIKAHNIML